MMNAENVKYYDKILSSINATFWGQLELKEATNLCDGDEHLAGVIAEEFKERDYANLYNAKEGGSLVLKDNGKSKVFEKQGGFTTEYERLNPPKTPAEKLNEHFYKIVDKGQVFPYEEEPIEVHNMRKDLKTYGLLDYDSTNNRYLPSKQGLTLAYCNGTVNEYIMKLNNPTPQPTTVNVNGNYIQGSEFNHSPVSSSNITNSNVPASEEEPKYKKWKIIGGIISGLIIAIATAASKLIE